MPNALNVFRGRVREWLVGFLCLLLGYVGGWYHHASVQEPQVVTDTLRVLQVDTVYQTLLVPDTLILVETQVDTVHVTTVDTLQVIEASTVQTATLFPDVYAPPVQVTYEWIREPYEPLQWWERAGWLTAGALLGYFLAPTETYVETVYVPVEPPRPPKHCSGKHC